MMDRRLVLIFACLGCTIVVGASFRAIPNNKPYTLDQYAKKIGVDPLELKKVGHMAAQLSSDTRHHRPPNEADKAYLLETFKKGGALAGETYWSLLPLKDSNYSKEVVKQAVKATKSANENEAIGAVAFLRRSGDYRWRMLAESRPELREAMAVFLED